MKKYGYEYREKKTDYSIFVTGFCFVVIIATVILIAVDIMK